MGIYSEYVGRKFDWAALAEERNRQLRRIADIRRRDVIVYAADIRKAAPVNLDPSDVLPIQDLLSDLSGAALDVIIETPGGSGEVAEQIVRMFRAKYPSVSFIIPGFAKSAGTIMVMSGDEILMGPTSALGPIDAQIQWQGKTFSADALLEGMEKIKKEVEESGVLNRAYIPILQGISPGELQSAENAQSFAKILVTDWLAKYKFQKWVTHSSSGLPVSDEDKRRRAGEIADQLCNHRTWLTHGRPILMEDLTAMRVIVSDFTKLGNLGDAISRYHALVQMSFDSLVYKLFESHRAKSSIYRSLPTAAAAPARPSPGPRGPAAGANIDLKCNNCGNEIPMFAILEPGTPLAPGRIPFPASDTFECPKCHTQLQLGPVRAGIEAQIGRAIISPTP